jgi:hypothetical protein
MAIGRVIAIEVDECPSPVDVSKLFFERGR